MPDEEERMTWQPGDLEIVGEGEEPEDATEEEEKDAEGAETVTLEMDE